MAVSEAFSAAAVALSALFAAVVGFGVLIADLLSILLAFLCSAFAVLAV
jgi:hypothetical protein